MINRGVGFFLISCKGSCFFEVLNLGTGQFRKHSLQFHCVLLWFSLIVQYLQEERMEEDYGRVFNDPSPAEGEVRGVSPKGTHPTGMGMTWCKAPDCSES